MKKWIERLRARLKNWLRRGLRLALKKLGHTTFMVGTAYLTVHNPDGSLAWTREVAVNGDTYAGLNDMLSVYFASGTQKTTWYCGLINSSGFSTLSVNDTIASHAGWAELTGYDEATRRTLTFGSPASGVISASVATFTMSGTVAIKGAFFVSDSTKSGATGVMFCTDEFDNEQNLTVGQTLSVTFVKTATPT
jgi:hypothetical protein